MRPTSDEYTSKPSPRSNQREPNRVAAMRPRRAVVITRPAVNKHHGSKHGRDHRDPTTPVLQFLRGLCARQGLLAAFVASLGELGERGEF
jgi:hypothetical protein